MILLVVDLVDRSMACYAGRDDAAYFSSDYLRLYVISLSINVLFSRRLRFSPSSAAEFPFAPRAPHDNSH